MLFTGFSRTKQKSKYGTFEIFRLKVTFRAVILVVTDNTILLFVLDTTEQHVLCKFFGTNHFLGKASRLSLFSAEGFVGSR